jgi:hypothetical protein
MQVNFKFSLGESVVITEINRKGLVTGAGYYKAGIQYSVSYFDNSDKKTEWFYEQELSEFEKTPLGFNKEIPSSPSLFVDKNPTSNESSNTPFIFHK